jgi:hypothetical protein
MGLLLTVAVGSVLVASLSVLPLLLFRSIPHYPAAPLREEIVADSLPSENAEWKRAAGRR